MDSWAQDLTSWDLCDGLCTELLRKTPHAYAKIEQWSRREEEFVKRAAFTLIATLAVHDKRAGDETFLALGAGRHPRWSSLPSADA
jgi:3-methyladenine DNA glycosylase AlkD